MIKRLDDIPHVLLLCGFHIYRVTLPVDKAMKMKQTKFR